MKANILVIDDEESIRFSFDRFLAAEGHNVITAQGYREAMTRMDETQFDLILADIVLDDGWGIDILQEVIRRNLKTRVIIMTAYPTTETIKASFAMQAIDYLTKPLRQEGLLYCVSKALQQIELGEGGGADPVGKAFPTACDAFSSVNVAYSSNVNVNAPDRKGTNRMQKGPVCFPVADQGVSGYEHSSHLPKIS
jgi:DNA-binding NtrC family response regulator